MFNEIGVPMTDAEMNMLPPGQNKPHQQMMAESGIEMNITWMAGAAIASGISGFMGSRNARQDAKNKAAQQYIAEQKRYVAEVRQASYKNRYEELMIDVANDRIALEYDHQIADFKQQRKFNAAAASASFVAEQFKYTEQLEAAAEQRNKMAKELMRVQGMAAASGRGNASQSRDRANMINTLTEYGQEQAAFDRSLFSARAAYKQRVGAIAGALENVDYTAWTKIAIPPALQVPGAIQMPGPTATKPASPSGGFFSDVMSGISGRISTFAGVGGATGGFWNKSDVELKENIEQVGVSPSGLNIYEWNYIGDKPRYRGVIAQDLLAKGRHDAVTEDDDGYLAVYYDKIDVYMAQV